MQTLIDPFQVRATIVDNLQDYLKKPDNHKDSDVYWLKDCNVFADVDWDFRYDDDAPSNLIVKTFRVAYFPIKDPSGGKEKMVAQVYLSFTLHTTTKGMRYAEYELMKLIEMLMKIDVGHEGVRLNISDVPLHWRAVKGSETHIEKIADSEGLSKVNIISIDASCQIPM